MRKRSLQWFLVIGFLLSMPACAPATAQPTATPTPTVAPAIISDAVQPLVLVLPGYGDQKSLVTANRHYSDAVKQKGWNVDFYTVHRSSDDVTGDFLYYVQKQLCSGIAQADGYICVQGLYDDGQALRQAKADGQLYDCASVAASVVPQYWHKFQDQISAAHFGLALANQMAPIRILQPVLLVRDDILPLAQQRMTGYDDLRALIVLLQQGHPANGYVQAEAEQLLDLWTKQRGYLALFADAGIYARVDDPDANPVLLEAIPGFEQFLQETVEEQANGLLRSGTVVASADGSVISSGQHADTRNAEPVAAVLDAVQLMYMDDGQGAPWKGYMAFVLPDDSPYADNAYEADYAGSADQPESLQELIIPARSSHAVDAMKFIQWLYADRRNADVAIYGKEGIDYRLQGERVELLGTAASDGNLSSWWSGHYIFQLAAEQRIDADAPKNAEALLHSQPTKPLAAPWLVCMGRTQALDRLTTPNLRQSALSPFLNMDFSFDTPLDAQSFLQQLRASATEEILQPYLNVQAEARIIANQPK